MAKFTGSVKKEFLLLGRDLPGLAILFVMPVLLIFVVTLAQENALKNQISKTPVLLATEGTPAFAKELSGNLKASGIFQAIDSLNNLPVDREKALQLIASGSYKFGILFSKEDTSVTILVDPALQPSYRSASLNALTYVIKGTQSRLAIDDMLAATSVEMKPVIRAMITESLDNLPSITSRSPDGNRERLLPTPIQNNVPGFILFAMFFVVIPLSGSIISEKNEGGFQRLMTLPVHAGTILAGKVGVYLLVCLLQFVVMLLVGIYAFPLFFDIPGLELNTPVFALFLATVTASLAAIGFGMIVGTYASTHNQAALFGSVMVVLLGIISGTFLPVHIMPEAIQTISMISPIRWGIDNYLDLFIRNGSVITILPRSLVLFAFFGLSMIISIAIFAKRRV